MVAVAALGCTGEAAVPPASVLRYEPAVVEVTGVIDTIHRYGPPGFGENPAVDREMVVSVVRLDRPVDLVADPGNPVNQAEPGVAVLQLVAPNDAQWADLHGARARVKGSLFHATDGTHFTNVLLSVDSVAPDGAASPSGSEPR